MSSSRIGGSLFSSPAQSTSIVRKSNIRTTPKPNTPRQSTVRTEQILDENDTFILKAKNSPVPVQVQEVLRNYSQNVSLKLDPSGWSWIVSDCMVYLWRYTISQSTSSCIRITLPHSIDHNMLPWTADLIIVQIAKRSNELVCVIGSSPDGRVFFWKGTSEAVPYKEVKINLLNDSVIHSVCSLELLTGCALLTSKGTIYILSTTSQTPLKLEPPQGMLSGIGRRFSSFIFGSQTVINREPVRLLSVSVEDGGAELVCVLTDCHLQLWKILSIESGEQQMQYDVDMGIMIKDELASENWFNEDSNVMDECCVWLLDCQVSLLGFVILFACTDSNVMKYGLTLIPCDPDTVPYSCDQLIDLNYTQRYQVDLESNLLALKLKCCLSHSQAGVYCSRFIIPVQLNRIINGGEPRPDRKLSKIDLESQNAIIGSGTCQNEVLFFTLKHGILSLYVSPITDTSPQKRAKTRLSSVNKMAATPSHIVPRAPLSTDYPRDAYENETEELKNAFMLYLGNDLSASCQLCSRVLPNQSFTVGINTPGDVAAMNLSEMVLNDVPTMDPRWNDLSLSTPGLSESFSGVSSSLIIVQQLQDKLEAHTRLIQFITDVGLLDKLSCLSVRGKAMTTCDLLCEHAEKIIAGIVLKKNMNRIIDDSIKAVLQERPPLAHLHPGLTAQDIFFSQVASIDDIFGQLINSQTNAIRTIDNSADKLQTILNIATVVQNVFHEAIQYRKDQSRIYHSCSTKTILTEYLPWTASIGHTGGRTLLTEQLNCLIDIWNVCGRDPVRKNIEQVFWNQYCGLAQHLFNGYETQLQSIKSNQSEFKEQFEIVNEKYNNDRDQFIGFALDQQQVTVAIELAEGFHHFNTLIRICEQYENREDLKMYFDRFKAIGFGDVLFKYYLNTGNLKTLLSFSDCFPEELESFLSSHDTLSWVHYIATAQYDKAGKKLVQISNNEEEILARKKTILSIAKLSLIADDKDYNDSDDMKTISKQLRCIEYHENIDESILNREGINVEKMPLLSPDRVVELYVDQETSSVNQFLCALEYMATMFEDDTGNPDFTELLVYIWSKAILRDDWDEFDTDDALNTLSGTFFMNVVSIGISDGLDIISLLPNIDDMLQSDLLTHSDTFLFLIRAAYENISHTDAEQTP